MKKVLFTLLLAGVISFSASAQTRVGGLLGYGSEIESLAIGGVGEFMIKDNLGIAPSLVFFFPKNESGYKYSMWEINGNVNYYFVTEGTAHVYGLAGLNIASIKLNYDDDFFDDSSDTELGLNIGVGSNFTTNNENILPFAELKYVISDFDQLCIFAGVKFIVK
jgi:outer membrane protein X